MQTFNPKPQWLFRQSAVIPWRIHASKIQVLLITTRSQKRWTVPKGVLEFGYTAWDSAMKEAREEAGVRGKVNRRRIGEYQYKKWGGICHVDVYLMEVEEEFDEWPEMDSRRRKWFSVKKSSKKVKHKGLIPLLEQVPQLLLEQPAEPPLNFS